jgi:hypothetical protein
MAKPTIMAEKLGNTSFLNLKLQDVILRVSLTKKEKDDIANERPSN